MKREQMQKHIFMTGLLITLLVFAVGIISNYSLDFLRLDEINDVMEDHELSTQSYLLEQELVELTGGDVCEFLERRMASMNEEISDVATDMDHYSGKSIFKKGDFEYIRREFFLLELRYYTLIRVYNERCHRPIVPVLFFFETDDPESITQGYILEDIAKSRKKDVAILNFDIDFEEENLIELLKLSFNVTQAPTVIIDEREIFEGLAYTGVINGTITRDLRHMQADRYSQEVDYTLDAVGLNSTEFAADYLDIYGSVKDDDSVSDIAKGDMALIIGRLTGNKSMICSSLAHYDSATTEDDHEKNAMLYETIASVGCGRNREAWMSMAADEWEKAGWAMRAGLDRTVAEDGRNISFMPYPTIQDYSLDVPDDARGFVLGASSVRIDDDDLIVSQSDRVSRDWLSFQLQDPGSDELLRTFSERLSYDEDELREDIGWHEGARIEEMLGSGAGHDIVYSALVRRFDGDWYAPDAEGVFRFGVPDDKVYYPTTRFYDEATAFIVDTHGINQIASYAAWKDATIAVGCCDNTEKIKAALYLDSLGIDTLCFTDKYLPEILGSDADVLGSPPLQDRGDHMLAGYQPVDFSVNDTFIVMDATTDRFAMSYYKTPKYYFRELTEDIDLDVTYVTVTNFGQMGSVVDKALEKDADVIAARVFNSDDYGSLKGWLDSDASRRLVLFHSAAYPYGYLMYEEYPDRVTFDDITPVFY